METIEGWVIEIVGLVLIIVSAIGMIGGIWRGEVMGVSISILVMIVGLLLVGRRGIAKLLRSLVRL